MFWHLFHLWWLHHCHHHPKTSGNCPQPCETVGPLHCFARVVCGIAVPL